MAIFVFPVQLPGPATISELQFVGVRWATRRSRCVESMYDMYGTPASVKAAEVLRPVSRFASTVSRSHANGGDDAATRAAAGFVTNTLVTGSIRDTTASPKAIRLPSMAIRYRVLFKGRRRMKVLLQPAKSSRGPRAGRTEREKSPRSEERRVGKEGRA